MQSRGDLMFKNYRIRMEVKSMVKRMKTCNQVLKPPYLLAGPGRASAMRILMQMDTTW